MRPPNGLRISRAAPIDRGDFQLIPSFKKATILRPHSGVGLHALVGPRHVALTEN